MPEDGKVPFEACDVLRVFDVNGVDFEHPLGKVPLDDQVLDVHTDLVVLLVVDGNIFDVVLLLDVVDLAVAIFVVVLWLDVVDCVLTIFDVMLLVDVCDELLDLDASRF